MAWRALKLYGRLFGRERLLRLSLDGHWILRRVAHELGIELVGDDYYWCATAFTPAKMAQWIPGQAVVLDVGCGDGRVARAAARIARRVVAIDYDASRIDQARRITPESNVDYLVADASSGLPQTLEQTRFDVALLIAVLEHLDDPNPILSRLRTISGAIIVEVPFVGSDPLNSLRRRMRCRFYTDVDHVREYTTVMLTDELRRNGWRLEDLDHAAGNLLARAVPA